MKIINKRRNLSGFTLAELLIVIAIIAILIAIAVPVFNTSMKRAQMATDDANFRDAKSMAVTALLGGKIEAYGTDNELKVFDIDDVKGEFFYFLSDGHFIKSDVTPPAGVEYVTAKYTAEDADVSSGKYANASYHVKGAKIFIFCDNTPRTGEGMGSTAKDDEYILDSEFGTVFMGFTP